MTSEAVDDAVAGDAAEPTAAAADGPAVREPERSVWVRRALIVVAIVPFVTAAVRAIADGWFPIGDSALLYLRTADVGTRYHPWLGSWSSASVSLGTDVNNPGPIYADLIAPFAHVFSPGVGNVLGVTTVNVACVIGSAVAARRIGGWRFERWVLVACAGLAWTMGSELLFDIFQAHALLFPFLLMLILVVGVLTRASWPWPWLVAVASVIVQTHISYAYIAAVLAVAMLAIVLLETRPPRWPAFREALSSTTARWSGSVFVVLWAQSFIEQLFGEGQGNLARLAANAGGTDISVGVANATRLVAAIVSLPPWWSRLGFADTIEPAGAVETDDGLVVQIPGLPSGAFAVTALLATVALLGHCLQRARRRGDRTVAAMSVISIVGVVGGIAALSRLTVGPVGLAPHHTRWVFVIALFAHLTLVWAAVEWLVPRLTPRLHGAGRDDTTVVTGLLVVMLSVANVPMFAQQHGPTDDAHTMPALRRLFDPLEALHDHEPVLYRTDNLRLYEPYSSTVQLELQHRGIDFRVADESLVRQLGNGRRADGSERSTLAQFEAWRVVSGDLPGCVLVRASRLDPAREAAFEADASALADAVTAGGFDVTGVFGAETADVTDRDLATRFSAGEIDTIREVTYDGRLRFWIERGWASGPSDVVARLRSEGPAITEWLDSVVALVVTPEDVCAG